MKKEEKENAGTPEIDRPGRMPVKEVGGKSTLKCKEEEEVDVHSEIRDISCMI